MTRDEAQKEYDKMRKQQESELNRAEKKYRDKNKTNPTSESQLKDYGYDSASWASKYSNFEKDIAKHNLYVNSDKKTIIAVYDRDSYVVEIEDSFDQYINKFFAVSEQTGTIPNKNIVSDVAKKAMSDLISNNDKYFNMSDKDRSSIYSALKTYCETKAQNAYQTSITNHPRTVVDTMPITEVDDGYLALLKARSDEINNIVEQAGDKKLDEWGKDNSYPGEAQASSWFDGEIARTVATQAKDYDKAERDYLTQMASGKKKLFLGKYKKRLGYTDIDDDETRQSNKTSGNNNGVKIHRSTMQVSDWSKTNVSFSGCDMVVSAEMKTTNGTRVSVTMGSTQTISYSIYRKLSPILCIGNVNAKDYVGGPRTIAGSIVFTVFNQHWGTELIDQWQRAEGLAANKKVLMDEIAPLDITISMANEYGVCSRLALYSVRLFSEGQVMSINDIYTENTYQYVALNIDYLADINSEIDTSTSATVTPPTVAKSIKPVKDGGKTVTQDFNSKTDDRIKPPSYQMQVDPSKFKTRKQTIAYLEGLKKQAEDGYKKLYNQGAMSAELYKEYMSKSQGSYAKTVDRINAYYEGTM